MPSWGNPLFLALLDTTLGSAFNILDIRLSHHLQNLFWCSGDELTFHTPHNVLYLQPSSNPPWKDNNWQEREIACLKLQSIPISKASSRSLAPIGIIPLLPTPTWESRIRQKLKKSYHQTHTERVHQPLIETTTKNCSGDQHQLKPNHWLTGMWSKRDWASCSFTGCTSFSLKLVLNSRTCKKQNMNKDKGFLSPRSWCQSQRRQGSQLLEDRPCRMQPCFLFMNSL